MFIIFHDGEIWDQYEPDGLQRPEPIPLNAFCYDDVHKFWWRWFYSWNNVTKDIESGGRELPPIAKAWLLVMEDE